MVIKYWTNFSKREDETLLPTGTGTQITVTLKEPCSILRPSFILSSNISGLNYIRVDEWGRYYFVTEKTYLSNDTYRIDCVYDPLASYKTQIGSYYGNVEYTASSTNILVNDPRNKPTIDVMQETTSIFDLTDYGFLTSIANGYYIVGIAADFGVKYLEMTETELKDLCGVVFSDTFAGQINSTFYDLKNVIVSCIKIPYTKSMRTAIPGGLTINGINVLNTTYQASPRIVHDLGGVECSFAMPDPTGLDVYSYLDQAPYTTGLIYLPYVGVVPLDLEIFAKNQKFILDMYFDECTGDVIYRISNVTGDYVNTYSGNCATNIPISGSSYNAIGAIGSAVSAIGGVGMIGAGAASGNPAIALTGATSLISAATSAYESLRVHTQVNGSISSALGCAVGSVGKVMVFKKKPTETDLTSFRSISGMPYFKSATIGNLSGYVKCSGASVPIAGFKEEKDAVNSYLNKGFYYT